MRCARALALSSLRNCPRQTLPRTARVARYFAHLDRMQDYLSVPFRHFDRGTPTYHIMPILLHENIDRAKLIDLMKEDGIQTSIHYPSIQSFTAYKDRVGPTPKSQFVSEHELTLPLYPTMTDEEVDLVCDSLEKNLPLAIV